MFDNADEEGMVALIVPPESRGRLLRAWQHQTQRPEERESSTLVFVGRPRDELWMLQ